MTCNHSLADMHPDSTLINGLGRTRLKNGEVKGDLAVITVTKGKRSYLSPPFSHVLNVSKIPFPPLEHRL